MGLFFIKKIWLFVFLNLSITYFLMAEHSQEKINKVKKLLELFEIPDNDDNEFFFKDLLRLSEASLIKIIFEIEKKKLSKLTQFILDT